MDNCNVVFGRVISGLRAFKLIEKVYCINQKPKVACKITESGELYLKSHTEKVEEEKAAEEKTRQEKEVKK
jgi:cyclophilin family peptidyl-prolyl cis-trans isomerase